MRVFISGPQGCGKSYFARQLAGPKTTILFDWGPGVPIPKGSVVVCSNTKPSAKVLQQHELVLLTMRFQQ